MASKQKAMKQDRPLGRDADPVAVPPGLSEAGKRWVAENQEAIRSSNEYVEKHGLPLAKYRAFKWQD